MFQLHETFAYKRVVQTPDPTIIAAVEPSLQYTDDLLTLFDVQAVDPTGTATIRVLRNGMQTLERPGSLPYHRQLRYPALPPLTLTPTCSAATGFAGSIPLSLTLLAATPAHTIRPGERWMARIAGTALGTYGQPYTMTTQDHVVRMLTVSTAHGQTQAMEIGVHAHTTYVDPLEVTDRHVQTRTSVTVNGTGRISQSLGRVVGVTMTVTHRSIGIVDRPHLPSVPYAAQDTMALSATDIAIVMP